jgi:GntP family gluconate:H+ symporter
MPSSAILFIVLLISVLFIILGTTKLKLHPFIVLILAAYFAGASGGLPLEKLASTIATGFGNIMATIGIVIILGTIIGSILEKSNASIKLAEMVLKVVGPRYPALAMSIVGYIVSIPVFCDSGFVILSSLRKSLAAKTGKPSIALTIALSTGLYATHTFVPPTPGPIAAAGNLGLENQLGLVILAGLAVALVAALAGYLWAVYSGKKYISNSDLQIQDELLQTGKLPLGITSILPVIIPILLIAMRSVVTYPGKHLGDGLIFKILDVSGQPINALLIGLMFSLFLFPKFNKETLTGWVGEGVLAAGPILLITGAGGAFGAVLKETKIGEVIGQVLAGYHLGIFLPFIIAAAFKTAQGSTTVSLVATSSLVYPLLTSLGLDSEYGRVLTVMATGAGAMCVSHANDSYFWVVTQFSGLDVKTGLKTHTIATLLQGAMAMIIIWISSLLI